MGDLGRSGSRAATTAWCGIARASNSRGAGEAGGDPLVRADRRRRPHVGERPRRGQFAVLWRTQLRAAGRSCFDGGRESRRRECARHLGRAAACTDPPDKRVLTLADGTNDSARGLGIPALRRRICTPPRAPWEPTAGISMLYNAMIAPLGKFGLRGVAWYQGEAERSASRTRGVTRRCSRRCMADWRRQFDAPAAVPRRAARQLRTAGKHAGGERLGADCAKRSAARSRPTATPGLAVTIDIGNRDDIHPTNKQEVGQAPGARGASTWSTARRSRRPARSRMAACMRKDIVASGSPCHSRDFEGNARGRTTRKILRRFELCGATEGSLPLRACASLEGDSVVLTAEERREIPRACASAGPTARCAICTMRAGLPVGPFEIEVQ